MQLLFKLLSGKANCVDPDQEQSDLRLPALFAYVILSDTLVCEILEHLLYKVFFKQTFLVYGSK